MLLNVCLVIIKNGVLRSCTWCPLVISPRSRKRPTIASFVGPSSYLKVFVWSPPNLVFVIYHPVVIPTGRSVYLQTNV
ncbi:hypothetical protein E4T56_gene18638 [Termitomyces sp. T112]|nr:hypothetical protein E4T56_gene18638 [Termitomyces sp. T112]